VAVVKASTHVGVDEEAPNVVVEGSQNAFGLAILRGCVWVGNAQETPEEARCVRRLWLSNSLSLLV